jgi:hypothetical protein
MLLVDRSPTKLSLCSESDLVGSKNKDGHFENIMRFE